VRFTAGAFEGYEIGNLRYYAPVFMWPSVRAKYESLWLKWAAISASAAAEWCAMTQRAAPYASVAARGKTERLESPENDATDAHAYRRGSPVKTRSPSDAALLGTEDDRGDPGDDDLVDDLDEAAAYAAFLQEQAEMRAKFTFRDERRKTLGDKFIAAMRRKRRLLGRNENLRFRELYKPPEPIAVLLVIVVATCVTLIVTKSWPFY